MGCIGEGETFFLGRDGSLGGGGGVGKSIEARFFSPPLAGLISFETEIGVIFYSNLSPLLGS